ncbi:16368_t:CDS:2 [Funneliformis mosseae]|uniref:16368_t:CDS:1 n=1 Tax=Funneliformis mosseae TaxID=27381 RepID=A0A9N9CJF4_FUNMO|nr:16368_t:CDS:2 [Funneliformis mosseae]
MLESLKSKVEEGELDYDEIPKLQTIQGWIFRYSTQHRQKMAEKSVDMLGATKDVERFSTEQLINFLRTKNLYLNNNDYGKIRDERVTGFDFLQLTREILRAEPYRFPDGPARRIALLVNSLKSHRLLSQEQALSCIPLPIGYHPDVITSQNTTTKILLWDDLFEKINKFHFDNEPKFERPQFTNFPSCINEEDIRIPIAGIPEFVTMFASFEFIAPIEIKREHVFQLLLQSNDEQTFWILMKQTNVMK